jgi:hypothetical protein
MERQERKMGMKSQLSGQALTGEFFEKAATTRRHSQHIRFLRG